MSHEQLHPQQIKPPSIHDPWVDTRAPLKEAKYPIDAQYVHHQAQQGVQHTQHTEPQVPSPQPTEDTQQLYEDLVEKRSQLEKKLVEKIRRLRDELVDANTDPSQTDEIVKVVELELEDSEEFEELMMTLGEDGVLDAETLIELMKNNGIDLLSSEWDDIAVEFIPVSDTDFFDDEEDKKEL